MHQLVRQQAAIVFVIGIIGEEIGLAGVFRAAMMLEPDAAQFVGQCEEKFVMVEMARAEQCDRFVDETTVLRDGFSRYFEVLLLVGDDIERDALTQIPFAEIFAREDRRIDQCLVIG